MSTDRSAQTTLDARELAAVVAALEFFLGAMSEDCHLAKDWGSPLSTAETNQLCDRLKGAMP